MGITMIDITKIQPGKTRLKLIKNINEPGVSIGDIFEVYDAIPMANLIYVKYNGKAMGGYFPSFFEIYDEPDPKPNFKLGKYKHDHFGIVEVVAISEGKAWCKTTGGKMMTISQQTLTPVGKFEHLRNLPVDTKVYVWIDGWKKFKRHFSHVSDNGDTVCCFESGESSFTSLFGTASWPNCEVFVEKNNE